MTVNNLYSKINQLQEERLAELLLFVEYLLNKDKNAHEQHAEKRKPKFGSAKGTFIMAPNFDEPLDHFNDYMP